jgi:hypothetical protein
MTTVINNPNTNNPGENNSNSSGASGVVVGAVIVILILVAVLIYAIPYLRERIDSMSRPGNPVINPTINVQLPNPPAPTSSTTSK